MTRIVLFLIGIGALALGVAWIADQSGEVSLLWDGWRLSTTVPVALAALLLALAVLMAVWAILSGLLRVPARLRTARIARKTRRGRDAIAKGLIAIGAGDPEAARRHADIAARNAGHDPLTLLLAAQSAQLSGDRDSAQRAFRAMAERADTRLLGLRGLFIEAQRNDDPLHAVAAAEEALKITPSAGWASHAVLGFRCAQGDWSGALAIVERNAASGAINRATHRRQRAVLLTARALEAQASDRDAAKANVMEAVKLAPTLIPAVVLAAKFLSENQQTRKAMQLVEVAWRAQPHPDLASAYAHVRLGDSALERLRRMERLAEMTPDHPEGALGVARIAADAREFALARAALTPLLAAPTQRVALLMAEIERGEHDDEGAARAWTLRAVHAALDPAWTADGFISDVWRPVSPVTGRLDAFQWTVPVAALPSAHAVEPIETPPADRLVPPPAAEPVTETADAPASPVEAEKEAPGDVSKDESGEALKNTAESAPERPVPVFRPRIVTVTDRPTAAIPAVIPLMRAPDDPGVDDRDADPSAGETPVAAQAGGFRGFMARWLG